MTRDLADGWAGVVPTAVLGRTSVHDPLRRGRYQARVADCEAEVAACQRLRARSFSLNSDIDDDGLDHERIHLLVEDLSMGQIVACCRLLPVTCDTLTTSYAAQHYDLSPLQAYEGAMIELGRFCVVTPRLDPDVVRLMWAAITTYVDAHEVTLMFGCTSFAGIQPAAHSDALAVLRDHHVGPDCWRPGVKSREAVRFPAHTPCRAGQRKGLREMPSLLRSYLMMGGWVSDHAVVDRHMNTLHVFTAIETLSIPAIRKRLLRALV